MNNLAADVQGGWAALVHVPRRVSGVAAVPAGFTHVPLGLELLVQNVD